MGAGSPCFGNGKNPGVTRKSGNSSDKEFDILSEHSQIRLNVDKMRRQYPLSKEGYFGVKGKYSRIIVSDSPISTSEDFANKLASGFARTPIGNVGWYVTTDDGTTITYRVVTSTPNSPAVDINIKNANSPLVKNQKIHFTTEGDWKKNEHRK